MLNLYESDYYNYKKNTGITYWLECWLEYNGESVGSVSWVKIQACIQNANVHLHFVHFVCHTFVCCLAMNGSDYLKKVENLEKKCDRVHFVLR